MYGAFNTASSAATSDSRRIEMIIIKTKEKGVEKNRNEKERKEKRSKKDGNILYDTKNILRRREAVEKKRLEKGGEKRKR
jgi:hypothetical protein